MTPEAHRHAAREALERAKIANIEVLPWPEVGEAYRFALTAIDGRKMRSEELKGKVVLIDCWSSTSSPCMAMMPELKTFYERWHRYGLEIIGVSLDRDVETVRTTCRTEVLTWPQVFVPDDNAIRDLWREAFGNLSIPRVLLIDREGILRDPPGKLEEKIGELLARSSDKAPAKPKP